MPLFKKKNKVYLSEFCTEYYDKNFLEPIIGGIDMSNSYNELIVQKIIEADNSFAQIDFNKFSDEILILRFELFSLAWFHQFGDKLAVNQSFFTKEYLIDKNREDLWEGAEPYNQAIAASATHGCTSATASGRVRLMYVNKTRMDLFNKYYNDNIDGKCIARALNRFGTDAGWKTMSITLGYIETTLCKNLNCNLNDEAAFRLIAVLKGFYDGSKQSLQEIKVIE